MQDDDGPELPSTQACPAAAAAAAAREANKVCAVCGDRALGCNFNAITCESCKAFFRRNALKNKEFRCPFAENCSVTPVTRRFCQKCRLNKCLQIGMKKELIMSEEDKILKRRKIEQNRAKKRPGSDSQTITKSKRESVDDASFDDTSTSIPSVTSIASAVSESYFWDSEKRYTDLDVKKQPTIDSMSPVAAASVPSPSSPPENCDIIGTKTLEMLKHSTAQIAYQSFEIDDRSDSYSPLSLNIEKNFSSQINFDTNSSNAFDQEKDQSGFTKMVDSNEKLANSSLAPSKCTGLETYLSNSNDHHQHGLYSESLSSNANLIESCINQVSSSMLQSNAEETVTCQKSKETCSRDSTNVSSKITQNAELITKLIQNPTIVTKILQDHNLLAKFITDPEVTNKLLSDSQLLQLLEQNIAAESVQGTTKNILLDNNEIFNKKALENEVENPILTNLITTQSAQEHKDQNIRNIIDEHKKINDITKDIFQDIQREPISPNTLESILCEAIKLEYSPYSTLSSVTSSRELNDAERAKLNELIVAHKALLAPLEEDITYLGQSSKKDPKLLGVINLTATAIRRLIKMSKKISAFKNMCQEDQLALLKGGCTEMMMLRSALNYDPDKETWDIPHSQHRIANIKVDILKEVHGNLYDEHKKFIRTFDSRWREENVILILTAIALFSPERPRVVHSDVIKLEQNSYYYLLRRYLESVYPGCEAKNNFLKLIQKMLELRKLNKEVVEVYLNVNPSSVEPLLIEIFDLKH